MLIFELGYCDLIKITDNIYEGLRSNLTGKLFPDFR
jgi:hypothetical protein